MLDWIFIFTIATFQVLVLLAGIIPQGENRKEYFWVTYVKKRIEKKKNFIVLISGPTGSGKSWAGLSLCSLLDKNFNPNRIVFGFRGLLSLINSGEEKMTSGSTILWDEFQLSGGARNWQSMANKLLNSLLSTFRHRSFILVITSPFSEFLDSQARKLLHAEFNVVSIDYNEKKTKVKPYLLQYNSRNKKSYFKYLRVKTKLGIAPVKSWSIPAPASWIIDEYEKMKTDFTAQLNKDIETQLDQMDSKESGAVKKPMTDMQEKVLNLLDIHQDVSKVAKELGITERSIHFHKSQARKKGYLPKVYGNKEAKNDDMA